MDWVAAFFSLMGVWLGGMKLWYAWCFSVVGCILWTFIALANHLYGMAAVNALFAFVCAYNCRKWLKES